MNFKLIENKLQKIKCDECYYIEERKGITLTELKSLIGIKCPKCGYVMITLEDYLTYKRYSRIIEILNLVLFPIKLIDNIWGFIFKGKRKVSGLHYSTKTGIQELSKEETEKLAREVK